MGMKEEGDTSDVLSFTLLDRAPGSQTKFVMQCPSEEVKKTWVSKVASILYQQDMFTRSKC